MTTLILSAMVSVVVGPADGDAECSISSSLMRDFQHMQIEQIIGGVAGDTSAQAIQLRLRMNGEQLLEWVQIRAWDSAGENPITLIDFDETADAQIQYPLAGRRILIASPAFATYTHLPLSVDFPLAALIPASYLAAGRITYEFDLGTVYWSLAYGGDSYTGETAGSGINDDDGEFGPPYDGSLPWTGDHALCFQGEFYDLHTTNLSDYAASTGPAVFTNNDAVCCELAATPVVPTLSEWGLCALTILLLAAGISVLLRRQEPRKRTGCT